MISLFQINKNKLTDEVVISMQKYPGKDNNINNTRGTQQKPYKDGRNYQPVIGLTNKQTDIILKLM